MIFSFLMSFREMLEATMVIGTMAAILRRKDKIKSLIPLYSGSLCGMLVSLLMIIVSLLGTKLLGEGLRNTIQGIMLIFVACTMVYFILVVEKDEDDQEKYGKLQNNINRNSVQIFFFSLFIVFREGVELTVVNFVNLNHSLIPIVSGTLLGMVLAAAITVVTFRTARRLDLTIVFKILGFLLIIVSGFMFGEGVFKFIPNVNKLYETLTQVAFMAPFLYILGKNEIKPFNGE